MPEGEQQTLDFIVTLVQESKRPESEDFLSERGKKRRRVNPHPMTIKQRRENSKRTPKRRIGVFKPWWN